MLDTAASRCVSASLADLVRFDGHLGRGVERDGFFVTSVHFGLELNLYHSIVPNAQVLRVSVSTGCHLMRLLKLKTVSLPGPMVSSPVRHGARPNLPRLTAPNEAKLYFGCISHRIIFRVCFSPFKNFPSCFHCRVVLG